MTEDYVSFETAKLLKDKGFDEECCPWYGSDGNIHKTGCEMRNSDCALDSMMAPTLQMAMKWLREVHKLHISVIPNPLNWEHQDIQDGWGCEVTHLSDLSYDSDYIFFKKKYQTYESACDAAIKYCLENLI